MSRKEIRVHDSIEQVNENQWNNLVAHSEMGSVFQRFGWLRAVEAGFDSTPKHVVVAENGNLVGVCPNFEVPVELPDPLADRSPFAPRKAVSATPGFGGPVVNSTDESVLDPLFRGIEAATDDGTAYHQLDLLDGPYLGWGRYLEDRGYVPSLKSCRFVVDLNRGLDRIRDEMSKDRRYNLRKGEEQDFRVVDEDLDAETVGSFHEKYENAMDRVGAEPQPRRFFLELADGLEDRLRLFALEVDGERAGSHLYLLDDERSAVHHYASAVEADDFEYYPSELLHSHAIEWASGEGYDEYDFGETPSDFSDGLFDYKRQFGGELVPNLSWQAGRSLPQWYLFRLGRWAVRRWSDE